MAFEKEQKNHPVNQYGAPAKHGKGLGAKGTQKVTYSGSENKGVNGVSQQPKGKGEIHSPAGKVGKSGNARRGLWPQPESPNVG